MERLEGQEVGRLEAGHQHLLRGAVPTVWRVCARTGSALRCHGPGSPVACEVQVEHSRDCGVAGKGGHSRRKPFLRDLQ